MEDADRPRTAWGVHLTCYALLAAVFVYVLFERHRRPMVAGDEPAIEPTMIAQVQTRIDPNTARWDELARLPGLGPSLAQAIVAYREEQRAKIPAGHADPVVIFRRLQDLQAIRGLGEKKLRQMGPFLQFPADENPGE
jgi:DNA uptake protein ComE-like DNA-binding protein